MGAVAPKDYVAACFTSASLGDWLDQFQNFGKNKVLKHTGITL